MGESGELNWIVLFGGTLTILLFIVAILLLSWASHRRLLKAEAFTRQIIDRTSALIVLINSTGNISSFNNAFGSLFKSQLSDNDTQNFFKILPLEQSKIDAIRGGNEVNVESFVVTGGEENVGDRIYIDWIFRPFQFEFGDEQLILATGIDVTQRTQAEEKVRLHQKRLKQLSAQLIHAHEQERERIARELHDEFGQALTAIRVNLTEIEYDIREKKEESLAHRIQDSKALIASSISNMRDLAHELRPSIIDDIGLVAAVRSYGNQFANRLNIGFDFRITGQERKLSHEEEIVIYRIVQEACNNITKHAEAANVWIHISFQDSRVDLTIRDDGKGFEPSRIESNGDIRCGIGLLGMEERVSHIGGQFQVESQVGNGTKIHVSIPEGGGHE
ncbi:MAG: sensor histidine kinase [Candidatus Marinimicrobia bacterium]|nr:sensor histidine kinase [Candidatus Neomarinimicrobiota bacterium]MCF7828102.1 sensor histidine kinase [Candidatus Neomarinimicrobiota bacterium]MCF7879723.1 sensor histidine kinase [Candidatus Neomarinimicrobiota bacterium]